MNHRYSLKAFEGLKLRGFYSDETPTYIYPTPEHSGLKACEHDSAAICDNCTVEVYK